jgi:NAD(P)-dependent dehydrogenase (short-subunit alcohol dehydrogenase family)
MRVAPSPSREKVAVVTGATSGIGAATARRLLRANFRVVAIGRAEKALAALLAEAPERVRTVRADLTDDAAITMIARSIPEYEDRVDVLVNAAGVIASDALAGLKRDDFLRMTSLNVLAPVLLTQALLTWLEATKGSVVNVSSVTGVRAFPGIFSYCVTKAALDQATRCAALELAPRGVRVNAVNPGVVVTELHKRGGMDDAAYATFLERSKTTHPLGRPGTAEEVAEAIFFLATTATFTTGVTLQVDGGRAETCAR